MGISSVEIKNFKSFRNVTVKLGKFNVLIGANASGKSNFVSVFKFLRDIINSGLDNAISLQGGVEYLINMGIGVDESMSIKIISEEEEFVRVSNIKKGDTAFKTIETTYEFALKFDKRGSGFKVVEDGLIQKMEFLRLKKANQKIREEKLGEGKIKFSNKNGKISANFEKSENVKIEKEDLYPAFLYEEKLPNHILLMEAPFFMLFFPSLKRIFREISIFDFDPKLPKKATPLTGKIELEEDGNNLSIVLKNIIEKRENKRKLFNLVKNLLPFVEDLDVEKFADKSLLFKLSESYFKNKFLPASLISDGTINITALIVALYFERKPLVIIEEPERNIHPYLISKIVEMIEDASQEKQIVITTHNPEFVRYAGLENILLVSRDNNGFSIISRPADKEEIKNFLENDIGIEELYIQNLLEV